ncbi:MAG: ATP-dependent helicase, partial [Desulfobacterales bacterium]|nr:ATP-dependent helicase [Desulfobacterales bacterium]
ALIGEWFSFYGPRPAEFIRDALGLDAESASAALDELVEARKIIAGRLVASRGEEVCDAANFEIMLRMNRDRGAVGFEPLPIKRLPLFLAQHHGIASPVDDPDGLAGCMDKLLCLPAPAAMWESEILPARVQPYDPSWLDAFIREGDLMWVGREKKRVAFCFESDLDLMEAT